MTFAPSPTVRQQLAAFLAVVALLGQTLVPHFHAVQRASPHAAAAFSGSERPVALLAPSAAAAADADGHRHAAGCPLCRAQSDARAALVAASSAVDLPAVASTCHVGARAFALATGARSAAAPRAPPAVA